jgi:hypothetical protein
MKSLLQTMAGVFSPALVGAAVVRLSAALGNQETDL